MAGKPQKKKVTRFSLQRVTRSLACSPEATQEIMAASQSQGVQWLIPAVAHVSCHVDQPMPLVFSQQLPSLSPIPLTGWCGASSCKRLTFHTLSGSFHDREQHRGCGDPNRFSSVARFDEIIRSLEEEPWEDLCISG